MSTSYSQIFQGQSYDDEKSAGNEEKNSEITEISESTVYQKDIEETLVETTV